MSAPGFVLLEDSTRFDGELCGDNKLAEGSPHVVDFISRGEVGLILNTPTGKGARSDGYEIRAEAIRRRVPCLGTLTGAAAAVRAISARAAGGTGELRSLQELHGNRATSVPRPGSDDLAADPRVIAADG